MQDNQADLIRAAKNLFAQKPVFVRGVISPDQLPSAPLPEVAFAGRSNVGKSSLINAVTGDPKLARTSATPGRTQEVNFFSLQGRLMMADLPGYGYAAAPEKKVQLWTRLIHDYLRGRPQLRRVFLLIDARHGIKPVDNNIMVMLDKAAVNYQIILTKADKLSPAAAEAVLSQTVAQGKMHVACHPDVILTSSCDGLNLDQIRVEMVKVLKGL